MIALDRADIARNASRGLGLRVLAVTLLVIAALLAGLGTVEIAARVLGSEDRNGNFILFGRRLRPYHVPIVSVGRKVDAYVAAGSATRTVYDPRLGWAPRPNATSADGLYRYNARAIRAPVEYEATPPPGRIRIALFGDSYTHGDEVPFEQTWGYFLERKLRAADHDAEVLNFGMSGYGTDQAFLRWRHAGRGFAPDVVVLGLFLTDLDRNLNLIRPLLNIYTDYPFSKPRFTLDGDQLVLINAPAVPPTDLVALLTRFEAWHLAAEEFFYRPEHHRSSFWLRSRALALVADGLARPRERRAVDRVSERLTLQILRRFRSEAEADGAAFLVVYLPSWEELRGGRRHADFLRRVGAEFDVVSASEPLAAHARRVSLRDLFVAAHYSAVANEIVAQAVASRLRPALERITARVAGRREGARLPAHVR